MHGTPQPGVPAKHFKLGESPQVSRLMVRSSSTDIEFHIRVERASSSCSSIDHISFETGILSSTAEIQVLTTRECDGPLDPKSASLTGLLGLAKVFCISISFELSG